MVPSTSQSTGTWCYTSRGMAADSESPCIVPGTSQSTGTWCCTSRGIAADSESPCMVLKKIGVTLLEEWQQILRVHARRQALANRQELGGALQE